jgi:hypothetical protein
LVLRRALGTALSPVLYVGHVELTDFERIGEQRYRFYMPGSLGPAYI